MQSQNEQMMLRCIQLAKNGLGTTYPNPLVGSVVVHNGKIIGEGWHQKSGKPHAEVNAINSVKDKNLLKESTLYVNLEPCNHFGKTPPCSLTIVEHKIPKVVIGTKDFAEHVNGTGISFLRENGVEVESGILSKECEELNRRFFSFHQKKRPYIILKWAETQNGFMSPIGETQQWITSTESKQLVHQWRTQEQGILVGRKTVEIDNPQLNARLWEGNQPIRMVIDNHLTLPSSLKVFQPLQKTIIFNSKQTKIEDHIEWIQLDFNKSIVRQILDVGYEKEIQSIIIEGGRITLDSFMEEDLWDEARILSGKVQWTNGIPSPHIFGTVKRNKRIGEEGLKIYRNL